MTKAVSQTLVWVNDQLGSTLQEARQALEDYIERPEHSASLARCADRMHQVHGALRMIEVHGAALLAQEMEQVSRAFLEEPVEKTRRGEALDALTRAMVQLPAYMDRVLSGGRDIPLVLLPLLNDLRAVRGHALLSENTLLLLDLPTDRQVERERPPQVMEETLSDLAKRLRPQYQMALLHWLRGQHTDSSLASMADIVANLEVCSVSERCFQLWWIASGVLEALRQDGLEATPAVKRLLGQVDLQIRRIIREGEDSFDADPPFELINSLLFYVARSLSRGRRVTAIRNCFSLNELIPAEDELEGARDSLSAPSVKLMHTVADAIREDLGRVKDVLDIFVRTGLNRIDDLVPQLELLKKIGDTLGVLGLGGLQIAVQRQAEQLREIVDGERVPGEDELLAVATTLIEVEDTLDSQLVGLIHDDAPPPADESDLAAVESQRDFQQVTATVLKECIVNLGLVKEAIVQSLDAPLEPHVLDEVPNHMRGLTAGLLMLDRSRAVNIVERIGSNIRRWLAIGDAVPSVEALDRLADAIVSVEYYMETIESGRSDPMYMLDNAESCLAALDSMPLADLEAATPELPPAATVRMPAMAPAAEAPETELAETVTYEKTQVMETPAVAAGGSEATEVLGAPPPRVGPEPGRVDPELLELFIEEAGELHATMVERFPLWESDPALEDVLGDLRRQYHTLKGSGRMVGAETLGEFGWAVENLLNRLIAGSIERTDAIVGFIKAAIDLVPQLIEQLETGRIPDQDVAAFIDQAGAFAERRPEAEEMMEATLSGREIKALPEETAPQEMDPVLREIFTKEASGHLATIRDYLEACESEQPPYAITEELHRACHTLSGSANMAGVAPAVTLAAPLNQLIRRLHEDQAGLSDTQLALCRRATDDVVRIVASIEADEPIRMEVEGLAGELRNELSEHVLRAEAAAEEEAATELRVPAAEEADEIDFDLSAMDEEAVEQIREETALLETLFAGEPPVVEEPAPEPEAEIPVTEAAEPPAAGEKAPAPVDLDPEIAGIFCEEATELLDQADTVLAAWQEAPPDEGHLDELQRHLHTLKGGARLAGVITMGDLSHRLETLVSDVAAGRIEASADTGRMIQRCLDELHRMQTVVAGGRIPDPAATLLAEIDSFSAGEPVTAIEPVPELAPAEAPEEPVEAIEAAEAGEEAAAAYAAEAEEPVEAPPEAEVEAQFEEAFEEPVEFEPRVVEPAFLPPPAAAAQLWAIASPPPAEPEPVVAPTAPVEPALPTEPAPILPEVAEFTVASPAFARPEVARVDADLLESLLNSAGEISIFRSRLEQQLGSIDFNLEELNQTVVRLRDQLRKFEMETEAQILHSHHDLAPRRDDFDPLEMDRYSMIQQLSRALAETANDVASLQQLLSGLSRDAETLLTQQARVITELQDGLMRTRMVPFNQHAQRMSRIVRQAATETGKQAHLQMHGATSELDRQVMERMLPPFEHLLRNAVIHGIETPEVRLQRDKPEAGRIDIRLRREGAEMIIEVADDGNGLDIAAIQRRAELQGLYAGGEPLTADAAADLILKPGFSTAAQLTQAAGRGVGMDVVATEIRELGGSMHVDSAAGEGTRFLIRLPYTRAITQALIVRCGEETFALPLPTVEGVVRLPGRELVRHLGDKPTPYRYGERDYHFRHLATLVDGHAHPLPEDDTSIPVILVRAGELSSALLTDELIGAREIVVKTLGPQLAGIRGLSGATILGDGRVVMILDAGALIRSRPDAEHAYPESVEAEPRDTRTCVMVVDDSITVRRVTERFLERNGMRVVTAKDGVDAIAQLHEQLPDIMLLDIEMPRMDGYEVATHVRADPRLRHIPIVMITSRVGKKHRARAIDAGVDEYLGKPYQESQLLAVIESLSPGRRERRVHE